MVGAMLDLLSTEWSWVSGLQVRIKAMGADERACDERAPPGHVGGDLHGKDRAGTGNGAEADLRGGQAGEAERLGVWGGGFKKGGCCWDVGKARAESSRGHSDGRRPGGWGSFAQQWGAPRPGGWR